MARKEETTNTSDVTRPSDVIRPRKTSKPFEMKTKNKKMKKKITITFEKKLNL